MISFSNGGKLLEPGDSLEPVLAGIGAKRLYLDFETTSFSFDRYGNRPYAGDRACGFAVTWDDCPHAFYVPMRHEVRANDANLPLDRSQYVLRQLVTTCEEWVNHNVGAFDSHFAAQDGAEFTGKLIDTLQLAKLIDSDRLTKGGYGLDVLSLDWLDKPIGSYENRVKEFLASMKRGNKQCRDYAAVPADIMAEYACQDVITNRALYYRMLRAKDDVISKVWDLEVLMTPVIYDITKSGLRVDLGELQALEIQIMTELAYLEEALHKEVGFACVPSNTDHCYELLINRFGLPILAWTDSAPPGPSFDKDALVSYLSHPMVVGNAQLTKIVKLIQLYRKRATLLTFFVKPYQERQVDGILHSSYNQIVRTGRMSSKEPNSQQLSDEAKELVHPDPGCAFLSADESQIEFRIIGHYVKEQTIIEAYAANPDVDFHQVVADMCGVDRDPAKNVNFAIGFGGGKKKVISMLASNMQLVGDLGRVADEAIARGEVRADRRKEYFDHLCMQRGEEVYNRYHHMMPGLKIETDLCGKTARARGWVKTAYGRKRHIPEKAAWKAFNSVVQGTAADVIKESAVKLAPRYNKIIRDAGIQIKAQVHDQNLLHGPTDVMRDPVIHREVARCMEEPSVQFRIPLRVAMGVSDVSWKKADEKANRVTIRRQA